MYEGILLLNKPIGCTSFHLVSLLRRKLTIQKIGHAGTLDPQASGLMIMLIGKNYTRQSDFFLNCDKEYRATLYLGKTTTTFDGEGLYRNNEENPFLAPSDSLHSRSRVTLWKRVAPNEHFEDPSPQNSDSSHGSGMFVTESDYIPSLLEIKQAINSFQGIQEQIPPMFSAKKINGKKLYELARKGKMVPRVPQKVHLNIQLIDYSYPYLFLNISCSKGTYIRSLAHDLGQRLTCGAFLSDLKRTRSGCFHLSESIPLNFLEKPDFLCILSQKLIHTLPRAS
jgi:tRNA pseudouridine55 synthase